MRFNIYIFILSIGFFFSCKENRRVEYYANGNKKIETGVNDNGNLNGWFTSYYQNGQIAYEGEYKNGLKSGKHVQYYENGKLRDEFIYEIKDNKEVLVEKKKYAPDGLIYLSTKNVRQSFDIDVLDKNIAVGDTVKVAIKLLKPTYENSLVIIAPFDENLNLVDSVQPIQNFVGDTYHQVLVDVIPIKVGQNRFNGLFRDFTIDLIPGNDSLGYRIAEDSFFEFFITARDTNSI